MIIHSVKLINYKSIGETNNEIIIEPNVTTIIGKNESGKSNIIEGLGHISFTDDMPKAFKPENSNRNHFPQPEIEYHVVLKATKTENENYGISEDTVVSITKSFTKVSGGIERYYINEFLPIFEEMASLLKQNPFNYAGDSYQEYLNIIKVFRQEKNINPKLIISSMRYFNQRIDKVVSDEKDTIIGLFEKLKKVWEDIIFMLPSVHLYISKKVLKQQYTYDEIQKELSNPKAYPYSLLYELVAIADVNTDEFLVAAKGGSSGTQANLRNKIKSGILKNINKKFHTFYTVEKIDLEIEFSGNGISFNVSSDHGQLMLLSERSNGLRWILNMFIDVLANNICPRNILFLFDEPGVSLHINAQCELLKLFDEITKDSNQIVYTTHSPSMLTTNSSGLHRIRAVVKSVEGYSEIHKTAYDAKLASSCQQDTLAPIIKAIGMNLSNTLGPAKDKLNIICEGFSDYIYFKEMAKVFNMDNEKYNIIPSKGVTSAVKTSNILFGWGCPFVVVFDYDKEGVVKGGKEMSNSEIYTYGKEFIYIKEVAEDSIFSINEVDKFQIEDIVGVEVLKQYNPNGSLDKTLLAKLYCNDVENGKTSLTIECRDYFEKLLNRIERIYNLYFNS